MPMLMIEGKDVFKLRDYCKKHKTGCVVFKNKDGVFIGARAKPPIEPFYVIFFARAVGPSWRFRMNKMFGPDDFELPLPLEWLESAAKDDMLLRLGIKVTDKNTKLEPVMELYDL